MNERENEEERMKTCEVWKGLNFITGDKNGKDLPGCLVLPWVVQEYPLLYSPLCSLIIRDLPN